MESNSTDRGTGLPYVNNFWGTLITAVINAACVLLACRGGEITRTTVIVFAAVCGVITSVNNVLITSFFVGKMRKAGTLPTNPPRSGFMMKLPKSKLPLTLIFAVFFGALAAAGNWLIISFYAITDFRLERFAVWQAIYSCLLAYVISDLAVLRFVQPDCAKDDAPAQTGAVKVHNPLTLPAAFKNWLNTITDDFGFNMLFGLLLGGTVITAEQNVVITPTTRSGIVISALILGLIITVRMARPIAKSMYDARAAGELPLFATESKWLNRLPQKPWGMTAVLALPIMLISLLVCWSILTFFGFDTLNFFQFFIIRTIYVTLLSKGVVALMLARYRQPVKAGVQTGKGMTDNV